MQYNNGKAPTAGDKILFREVQFLIGTILYNGWVISLQEPDTVIVFQNTAGTPGYVMKPVKAHDCLLQSDVPMVP